MGDLHHTRAESDISQRCRFENAFALWEEPDIARTFENGFIGLEREADAFAANGKQRLNIVLVLCKGHASKGLREGLLPLWLGLKAEALEYKYRRRPAIAHTRRPRKCRRYSPRARSL